MDWPAALIPLGAVALGYIGTLATEERRDARAARRDARAGALEADDNRRLWETDFQRQSLFSLQDALLQLGRASSDAYLDYLQPAQDGATWKHRHSLDPEKESSLWEAMREVERFSVRIRDPGVRDSARRAVEFATSVRDGDTPASASDARASLGSTIDEANERIGVLLRRGDLSDLPTD